MASKFTFDITDQMEADALLQGVTADQMASDALKQRFDNSAIQADLIREQQRKSKLAKIADEAVKTKLVTDFEAAIDAELAKVAVVDDPAPAPSPAVEVTP